MIKKAKISVKDLQLGMYVAMLDRPWVGTPFSFQGVEVSSGNDIEKLRRHCEFVFIDTEKSSSQALTKLSLLGNAVANLKSKSTGKTNSKTESEPDAKRIINEASASKERVTAPTDRQFRLHIQRALKIHDAAHEYIKSMMTDVHDGKMVDVHEAKKIVHKLAENVIQNPTALVWLTQLKNRDEYTAIHSLNVCILSLCFGKFLGLSQFDLADLGLGAMLHDIGKLKIPLEVLNKPGRLSGEEYSIVKQHTIFGYELLKDKNGLSTSILNTIKHHHERVDGKGYPSLLPGDQIGYHTRMVSIVDAYDAITSKRAYKGAVTPHGAVDYLYHKNGINFDSDLVEKFVKYIGIYPIGSAVELTTGQVGIVVAENKQNQLLPIILLLLDENKLAYPNSKYINLASSTWKNKEKRPYIDRIVDADSYGLDIPIIMGKESTLLANP